MLSGVYSYKNVIDVPPLAMIDDILGVTKCNDEAVELNTIINVNVESKKLRLSEDKCYRIHMKTAKEAMYLGDNINEEGNINSTIEERRQKGVGM